MGRSQKPPRSEGKASKKRKLAVDSSDVPTKNNKQIGSDGLPAAILSPVKSSGRTKTRSRKRKRDKTTESGGEPPSRRAVRFSDIAVREQSGDKDSGSDDGGNRSQYKEFESSPIPIDFSSERG